MEMLCEKCNERAATVILTQIVGEKQIKLYLCESCAKSTEGWLSNDLNALQSFLNSIINGKTPINKNETVECKQCGMTLSDFKKTSKVGCSDCYQTFEQYFEPMIKRVHSHTQHTGKKPGKKIEEDKMKLKLIHLQNALKKAVEDEEYEIAAKLRDEIRLFKKGGISNEMV